MAAPQSSRAELDKLWNDLDAMGGGEGSGETPAAAISAPVTSSAPAITTETVEGGKGQNGSKADYSKNAKDAQDAMDFLDELSQRSSTPITLPSHATQVPARKSLEASRPNSRGSFRDTTTPQPPASSQKQSQGSWGWSSVWSQASTVLQQAKQTAEENLAHISHQTPTEGSDQARKWTEHMLGYVKQHTHGLDVDKLRESGSKAFMDVLNAVAPPIAEHTVVQVYLSHDMVGYEGVETLTYRALAKVMEQVEGGELHVNSGSTEQPQTSSVTDDERNLNTVAGFTEGYKLARANLDNLVKAQNMKQTEQTNHNDLPITVCPLYLRIQPVLAALPFSLDASDNPREQLFFILVLRDAQHNLERSTVSQSLPGAWLDIPFEQNEWVENEMVDVIKKATETIGQDWIRTRQTGQAQAVQEAARKLQAEQEQSAAPQTPSAQDQQSGDSGRSGSDVGQQQ